MGPREGLNQPSTETVHLFQRAAQRRHLVLCHPVAEVRQHGQRSQAACGLGPVSAQDARTVAGQIDPRHAAAAIGIDPGQPLSRLGVKAELALRQVGELGFGAQVITEAHRIAVEAQLAALAITHHHALHAGLRRALDAQRRHAAVHRDAGLA